MSSRMVEALLARIGDGAFKPGEGFEFPDYVGPKGGPEYDWRIGQRQAYRAEARRLEQVVLASEAIVAVDLAEHPKAWRAWERAYSERHSEGMHAVLEELAELANLMLP